MTKLVKSNKREEAFDSSKIYKAIINAMKSGSGLLRPKIAQVIKEEAEEKFTKKENVSSKEIDKFVISKLNEYGQELTAYAYERYKTTKAYQESESIIDKDIFGIVDGTNSVALDENSNKDGQLISTQRDLIAGIESRSYVERNIMPTHLLNAHREGLIHIHDTDYMIHKGIFNCFSNDTVIVTDEGCKAFKDFYDGDKVKVKDKDGIWRDATIRMYGKQKMNVITMHSGRCIKTIRATANHRWVLNDGSITTELKVGDKLYALKNSTNFEPLTKQEKRMFCLGFVIGDGTDMYPNKKVDYGVRVRLCGNKNQYLTYFEESGYDTGKFTKSEDNVAYNKKEISKQCFLNSKAWRVLNLNEKIALFNGLLAADGATGRNLLSTSDNRICELIEDLAPLSGYFISSKTEKVHNTNYKENARLVDYHFITEQRYNKLWVIDSITPYKTKSGNYNEMEAWCVEEPITHTFTLADGIVTGNCCLINLDDMLQNGTVINGKKIRKPKSFQTACTVATQISLQVAHGQYGGQTFSVSHLAPFVRISYEKWKRKVEEEMSLVNSNLSEQDIETIAWERTRDEVKSGVQTIQFQENTFSSSNGQTPFVSIFMWVNEKPEYINETAMIIEEMINLRYEGMENEYGVKVTPAFPKLLYVLDENNVPADSEYRYLTDMAVKCAARRMNPDFISAKVMREQFDGNVFPCMGCRSFLSPWKDKNGEYKFYGRFNRGVVTLNLVDAALSAKGSEERFWGILDERLELCKEALILRDGLIRNAHPTVSPIHWMYGALARLDKNGNYNHLLDGGYSSISLGYIGIHEMVKVMKGVSNTSPVGEEFALRVMDYLEAKTIEWRNIKGLHGCSLYGTPSESLTYKFAQKTAKRFGEIKGITDKDYFTNSYHVNVLEPIDAFSKLKFESKFQKRSKGGAVSYIEVPNMENNLEALSEIVDYMYETIQYAEINTRNGDSCGDCGFIGEMSCSDDGTWYCPQCGCTDKNKLTVVRRTCGYIGSTFWNKGKTQEINDRVQHI